MSRSYKHTPVYKGDNRTISVQYISMSYSKVGRGGCSESCKENFNLAASAKYSGE